MSNVIVKKLPPRHRHIRNRQIAIGRPQKWSVKIVVNRLIQNETETVTNDTKNNAIFSRKSWSTSTMTVDHSSKLNVVTDSAATEGLTKPATWRLLRQLKRSRWRPPTQFDMWHRQRRRSIVYTVQTWHTRRRRTTVLVLQVGRWDLACSESRHLWTNTARPSPLVLRQDSVQLRRPPCVNRTTGYELITHTELIRRRIPSYLSTYC